MPSIFARTPEEVNRPARMDRTTGMGPFPDVLEPVAATPPVARTRVGTRPWPYDPGYYEVVYQGEVAGEWIDLGLRDLRAIDLGNHITIASALSTTSFNVADRYSYAVI